MNQNASLNFNLQGQGRTWHFSLQRIYRGIRIVSTATRIPSFARMLSSRCVTSRFSSSFRNRDQINFGILIEITSESRSPCPGIRSQPIWPVNLQKIFLHFGYSFTVRLRCRAESVSVRRSSLLGTTMTGISTPARVSKKLNIQSLYRTDEVPSPWTSTGVPQWVHGVV
jgi:hypothetical protein